MPTIKELHSAALAARLDLKKARASGDEATIVEVKETFDKARSALFMATLIRHEESQAKSLYRR